jgi:pre-mRNA-processing factor 19
MSLTCEISGESIAVTPEEVVVTPTGHICIKRLLLTKLAENGGLDPFETIREIPLSEDQLVTLANSFQLQGGQQQAPISAPPRLQATSFPNILHHLQNEYDALVLELFDTRKALEDTRRELSQALYQNDAAIRVVARLAQERDTAKQELERWSASVGNIDGNGAKQVDPSTQEEDKTEPETKRRRLDPSTEPLFNDIPEEDLKMMTDAWVKMNKERKAMVKAAAADSPSSEDLAKFADIDMKAWHKSTNKGISCMAQTPGNEASLIATAGKDKQIVVYKVQEEVVMHTFAFGSVATCVDVCSTMVVAGDAKGQITAFCFGDDAGPVGELALGAPIVDISILPTSQHMCVTTSDSRVIVVCLAKEEKRLLHLSTFIADVDKKEEYTCGALQPDGLVYLAGTGQKFAIHLAGKFSFECSSFLASPCVLTSNISCCNSSRLKNCRMEKKLIQHARLLFRRTDIIMRSLMILPR